MHINKKYLLIGLQLLALAILPGCASLNSGVGGVFGFDTDLAIEFKVAADINPDDRSKPSPLFIRMYEMQAKKMVEKADFIDLYERDKEVLGADLLAMQKLKRLVPGENREDQFVLGEKTLYVALYAEFLQYKNAKYLLIIPVAPNNVVATAVTVEVTGNSIRLIDKATPDEDDDESSKEGMRTTHPKTNDDDF